MCKKHLLIIFLTVLILRNDAARILAYFPLPSLSHQFCFRQLTQELARRGHEIVVITTDPAFPKGQAPANLTEIDVHEVTYNIWNDNVRSEGNKDVHDQLRTVMSLSSGAFTAQMRYKEVDSLINSDKKFDLLIIQSCFWSTLYLSHLYKVPVIQISSFSPLPSEYEIFGTPRHPFLYPLNMQERIFNLTVWEHVTELYKHFKLYNLMDSQKNAEHHHIMKHFDPNIPTLNELEGNVDILLTNVFPIWAGLRPVSNTIIHMGGLPHKSPKSLPKDLQAYLDGSQNGVIFVSFGTNIKASQLPKAVRDTLLNVLSKLPYDVLMKWNEDNLPIQARNIKIGKWFPQSDVLRHPKIKLFISQAGLLSTDDAINAGVPIIGLPTFGDQWSNAEKYVHFNIGLTLNLFSLTEDKLRNAINKIISAESIYRHNIAILRSLMYDQPQRPLERAVWWTEHVLRHGGARHLRAPAAYMAWTEYYEIDLLCLILSISLSITVILIYCFYLLCLKNLQKNKKVKSK